MTELFRRATYYKAWVEIRIITEEGAFAATNSETVNEVPADYSGSELKVEVAQRLIFADAAGHQIELRLDDLMGVMDRDRHTGIGAEIMDEDGTTVLETIPAAGGDSSHLTKWYVRYRDRLTDEQKERADYVSSLVKEQTAVP